MGRFWILLCIVLLASAIVGESAQKEKKKEEKKKPEIGIYELKTENMHAKFTNWGASLMSFYLPDKHGKMADVVLGYDKVDDYKNDTVYFGASIGRVANRVGGAKFTLDGKTYKLVANDGKNSLHGGKPGYSDVVWKVFKYRKDGHKPYITFTYDSKDGEQGYPGELKVQVTYKLNKEDKSLKIEMVAKTGKKATPVNLAHHTYWNLGGHNSGDILSHKIQIHGSHITPTDDNLIPTGEIKPVKGTPFDFLHLRAIGSRLSEVPKGYDINYCIDVKNTDPDNLTKPAVILEDPKSGRKMELFSNQLGLQYYTGGMLKDVKGKDGAIYKAHAGLALETQGYPDSVNHHNFPSQIVKPKQTYTHVMLYKFSTNAKS
ncbi:hypothetical protein RND81_10G072700 [Saponaria officinalis]|uniref:Aldose 1-epimerase n=1 Tax=Saponaria officinalis TaxID=3572 RepID=A0AAW1I1L5_SAPOF